MPDPVRTRAREVYAAIAEIMEKTAYSPTQREVAKKLGISQKRTREHLLYLRERGYISFTDGAVRTLRIVQPLPSEA